MVFEYCYSNNTLLVCLSYNIPIIPGCCDTTWSTETIMPDAFSSLFLIGLYRPLFLHGHLFIFENIHDGQYSLYLLLLNSRSLLGRYPCSDSVNIWTKGKWFNRQCHIMNSVLYTLGPGDEMMLNHYSCVKYLDFIFNYFVLVGRVMRSSSLIGNMNSFVVVNVVPSLVRSS